MSCFYDGRLAGAIITNKNVHTFIKVDREFTVVAFVIINVDRFDVHRQVSFNMRSKKSINARIIFYMNIDAQTASVTTYANTNKEILRQAS